MAETSAAGRGESTLLAPRLLLVGASVVQAVVVIAASSARVGEVGDKACPGLQVANVASTRGANDLVVNMRTPHWTAYRINGLRSTMLASDRRNVLFRRATVTA